MIRCAHSAHHLFMGTSAFPLFIRTAFLVISLLAVELGSFNCHRTSARDSCWHPYTPILWRNDPWNRASDLASEL
ncbi:hypothetical protein BJY52DRAFT_1267059 [Lactarius psammicola]|nr:hypothetical protein BJY52DRAFT_1267059 [Lactarius psammicola]